MADEKKSDKSLTTDAAIANATETATGDRFAPSGITAEGYAGTRVRRWEKNQRGTAKKPGVVAKNYAHARKMDAGEARVRAFATLLGTCLVRKEKPVGAARLFRHGGAGVRKIMEEVKATEIESAVKTCVTLSGVKIV